MKQILQIFSGLLVIVGLLVGAWWLIGEVIEALSGLDKLVQAALIAVTGAAITAITALLVKKFEKKNEVEAQFREQKVKLFNDLLLQFSLLSDEEGRRNPEELAKFLKDFQRKLIFWGGPKVLTSFLAIRRGFAESKTIGDLGGTLRILGDLILAMRKDLGLSNRGIDKSSFAAHLILRHADAFLTYLKTNPEMTNDEYTQIEKALDITLGIQSSGK